MPRSLAVAVNAFLKLSGALRVIKTVGSAAIRCSAAKDGRPETISALLRKTKIARFQFLFFDLPY